MEKEAFIRENTEILNQLNQLIEKIEVNNIQNDYYNDNWLIKDVLGHIVWYEEEMVKLIETRSMDMTDKIWNNPLDTRNAMIYNVMKEYDWEELKLRHERAITKLDTLFDELPSVAFKDPTEFENMPVEWEPWKIFAGSTLWHYKDHFESLKKLIDY